MRGERGFALIEVVVSAALLTVVAGGVLAGIEGPSAISGKNEARSQASTLAQQDQERMRAMPFNSLVGYTQTTPVTVAGITYSRYSKAIWIRDNATPDSCTTPADDTSGDYLKITSQVTPPGGQRPVQIDSLLAAPAGGTSTKGTLAVQLKNQLDQPLVGQSVSIAGPQSMSVATNDVGCAAFGLVTQGNYTVTFSRTGWVDPSGLSSVTRSTSVSAGSTTIVNHSYAQAGTIHATIETSVIGTLKSSNARAATVTNGGIPAGTITYNAANQTTGQSTFDLAVYPFPTGYGVWAGACLTGNPVSYGKPATTASPGPGTTSNVAVRQPAINLTLKRNSVLYASNHVRVTSTDAGCNSVITSTTTAAGIFLDPGFAYGNYGVCGDDGTNHASGTIVGTNPAGTAIALDIPVANGNGNGNGNAVPVANQGICP
jgi:Tfp pilus assembly protein PilV